MLATNTASCIDTSTRWGRPVQSAVSRRERGFGPGVRVAGRLGAAHRRPVGVAGAEHVGAGGHDAEVRTRASPTAGPVAPNGRDAHPHRVRRPSPGSTSSVPGKPGVSMTTSASARSATERRVVGALRRRRCACPRSTQRSGRVRARSGCPSGGSTRTTSAPRSARMRPVSAAGSPARSTTRTPSSRARRHRCRLPAPPTRRPSRPDRATDCFLTSASAYSAGRAALDLGGADV